MLRSTSHLACPMSIFADRQVDRTKFPPQSSGGNRQVSIWQSQGQETWRSLVYGEYRRFYRVAMRGVCVGKTSEVLLGYSREIWT